LRAIDTPMPEIDVSNIPGMPLAPRRPNTAPTGPLPNPPPPPPLPSPASGGGRGNAGEGGPPRERRSGGG